MLPENTTSSYPLPALMISPDDRVTTALVDYERGGVAIQDVTQGLNYQNWTCYVEGVAIKLKADNAAPITMFERPGVTELSLTFDQNMNPAVAFCTADDMILWWFDSTITDHRFTSFGSGFKNPRITLDDKRMEYSPVSDIIFAYLKYVAATNTYSLCYRQQRDRFNTERVLRDGYNRKAKLKNVGMGLNWRLQFEMV